MARGDTQTGIGLKLSSFCTCGMSLHHLPQFQSHGNKLLQSLPLSPFRKNVSPIDLAYAEAFWVFQDGQKFFMGWGIYFFCRSETTERSNRVINSNRLSFQPFCKIFDAIFPHNGGKFHGLCNHCCDTGWNHMLDEFLDTVSLTQDVGVAFNQSGKENHPIRVDRSGSFGS